MSIRRRRLANGQKAFSNDASAYRLLFSQGRGRGCSCYRISHARRSLDQTIDRLLDTCLKFAHVSPPSAGCTALVLKPASALDPEVF
jgi:hypothetical protein